MLYDSILIQLYENQRERERVFKTLTNIELNSLFERDI